MSGPDHLPHLVTHSRTQLPLLRKSRLVSDEQETNCYNGCRQDGHREKSCGENHALSIAMFIYCTHQTEGGSIVMSRCQSVFLITGEPYSKWQLSCTVVNMVTMLHPLLCSDWLIAQGTCSEYAQRICCNLYYWSQILGIDASSALHPALHTAPCLSQNGAYVAAESGEYGWCSQEW